MIDLYYSPVTRSMRIRWLFEELEIPNNIKEIDYFHGGRDDPDFRKINPMASLPIIVDNDLVVIESGAIINYVLRQYGDGRFQPGDARSQALVDQWMYWSESIFAAHQRTFWEHCAPPPGGLPLAERLSSLGDGAKAKAIACLAMVENALGDGGFLCGDELTGADFMMCFPLYFAVRDGWLAHYPKLSAYIARIADRPAFKVASRESDAFMDALEARRRHRADERNG